MSEQHLGRFPDLLPLLVQLLHNREIDDSGATHDFLTSRIVTDDPFRLTGMSQAVARLRQAIHKLVLRDGRGVAWDAVFFRRGDLLGRIPGRVDVAYTLEVNEWNHEKRLQLHIQDLRETTKIGHR